MLSKALIFTEYSILVWTTSMCINTLKIKIQYKTKEILRIKLAWSLRFSSSLFPFFFNYAISRLKQIKHIEDKMNKEKRKT